MWDNPRQLNFAANLLFGAAALLLAVAALELLVRSPLFPVREIVVQGEVRRALRADLERAAKGLGGNFFAVDLRAARARLEQVPWVRRVDVRRVWPDRLEVKLEEHVALARWGASALVNTHGEVFSATQEGQLPLFVGPEGTAREITIQSRYFTRSLEAIGAVPVQVRVSPLRAWQLRLDNGLTLELGREQVEARLARFVGAYGAMIARLGADIRHVDLRYANGFAVRLPDPGSGQAPARGRGSR